MVRKFLIGALGGVMLAAAAQAQEAVEVSLSGDGFAYTPLFVAMAMGHFDEVGLKVTVQKASSGTKAAAAVVSGDADIYVGSTTNVINAQKQGVDMLAFGALVTQFTSNITVSKKWAADHGVTTDSSHEEKLKALKGMRVGVTGPGGGGDLILRYLAREAGLEPDRDMQIIGIGGSNSSLLAALQQDQVDAIAYSPPTSELAEKDQGAVILFNSNIGQVKSLDGFFYIAAVARRDWLDKHPETAIKFDAAIQMALNDLRDPKLTEKAKAGVRGKYIPDLEDAVLNKLWSDLDKTTPPTVTITKEMMEKVVDFANMFTTDKTDLAQTGKFYTNEYAAEAVKQVGNK